MTPDIIALCTNASLTDAQRFADPLTAAMALYAIDTPQRQAAFLATVGIESASLTAIEENLNYSSADRLAAIYPRVFKSATDAQPFVHNPVGLSRVLYQGYHGRGLIMLTWLDNYRKASAATGRDYTGHPEMLTQPSDAALSAAWFWSANGCNAPADRGDMTGVTRIVNGPALLRLADRTALFNKGLAAITAQGNPP